MTAFLDHRREVLARRTKHRLARIAERLELLEGYLAVYLNIDKVIKIIRTEDEPKPKLMAAFKINDRQAEAILNMRLRALRKLEEMQIREEHDALTKEQKDLKKPDGIGEAPIREADRGGEGGRRQVRLKTALGKRRTEFSSPPDVAEDFSAEALIEKEPITVICSQKLWLRSMKGHQEESDSVKYREGDRGRFWIHAETTDKLMMFATDGRFFTLDCSKLPGGRGQGEAIRSFIDLPPEADIVAMFVHKEGRKLLLAAHSGHGFVTNEDEAVAMTRSGKKVMNVPTGIEAQACAFVAGRLGRRARREPQAADLPARRSARARRAGAA